MSKLILWLAFISDSVEADYFSFDFSYRLTLLSPLKRNILSLLCDIENVIFRETEKMNDKGISESSSFCQYLRSDRIIQGVYLKSALFNVKLLILICQLFTVLQTKTSLIM